MSRPRARHRPKVHSRKKWFLLLPSIFPFFMQHFLKPAAGSAWAWIVPAQFFQQFLSAIDLPEAPFYLGFRGIAFPALAHGFAETDLLPYSLTYAWDTSSSGIVNGVWEYIFAE